jgi:hypothetical protein
VIVKLGADAGAAVRSGSGEHSPATEVVRAVDQRGLTLRPLLAEPAPADDPNASRFVVDAPDEVSAEDLRRELAGLDAVEEAFVKPPDALP